MKAVDPVPVKDIQVRLRCGLILAMALAAAGACAADPVQVKIEIGPDGRVTRERFLQANASPDAQVKAALEQAFDRMDTDHDNSLTLSELKAQARTEETPPPPSGPDDEPENEPAFPVMAGDSRASTGACPYAVVISATAAGKPEWKAVAEALIRKHKGTLVVYEGSVYNALPDLTRLQPRFTAFVARPEILGRIFVARVHRLTRRLDADPYTDTIWGIVSAGAPGAALRVASATEPRTVRSVISLTGVRNPLYDEVFTISDGAAGDWYWRQRGGAEKRGSDGDADRIQLFVDHFTRMQPDAIVASGHATERNLEMCFGKGNTEVRDGKWVGVVNWRRRGADEQVVPIPEDEHPRIFLGAGNCLIGNFQKRADSLAAVMIGRHAVNQFVGYTVPTWYGKGGWGTLNTWQDFAGTYSLAEAFFFNNQAITRELRTRFPESAGKILPVSERGEGLEALHGLTKENKDENGMLWDRDVVAFYGDPALRVTLDPAKNESRTRFSIKENGNRYRFEAVTEKEAGGTVALRFPRRIDGDLEVTSGQEHSPVIADDFILIPDAKLKPGEPLRVDFTARAHR
jgi:zinc protease